MRVEICQILDAGCNSTVDVLGISSWDEIEDWYVKWDTLHYWFKGSEEVHKITLDSNNGEVVDWKRPSSCEVLELDEDGDQTGEILDER